jgi:hypothetical protein
MPSIPLKSPIPPAGHEAGSELEREVAALIAKAPAPITPSTLRAALREYELKERRLRRLADSTKYEYRLILKELEEDFGALTVATFTPAFLLDLRNTWAPRGHRAANVRLQVLKNALWPSHRRRQDRRRRPVRPHPASPAAARSRGAAPDLAEARGAHGDRGCAKPDGKVGLARGVAIGRYTGAGARTS